CKLIGISRRTVYRMLERGELIAGKAGKRTILRRSDLDKLFEQPRTSTALENKKPPLLNGKVEAKNKISKPGTQTEEVQNKSVVIETSDLLSSATFSNQLNLFDDMI